MRSLQRSNKSGQRGDQVEARAQASRERVVDLAVESGQVGAPVATRGLMIVEISCAFLEWCVNEVRSQKFATTYINNAGDRVGEIAVAIPTGSKAANFVLAIVDGGSHLEDNIFVAIVVLAAAELWNDSVALITEGG